jgi:peptide/nickel transport system permease protein
MLAQSVQAVGTSLAYLIYFPGFAIFITVLAVNFLGDGLRDAFDPQSSH